MEENVKEFIEAINTHNVEALLQSITEDHLFIDAHGNKCSDVEELREAWTEYFQLFPDYKIDCSLCIENGDEHAIFGKASGTYSPDGELQKENCWESPAAWLVIVRDGLIAQVDVYCDTKKVYDIMEHADYEASLEDEEEYDSRVIKKTARISAPQNEVWKAWTTREGAITFFAPEAHIDFYPGGRYEMLFNLHAPEGSRGGEGVKLLSYVPESMLSFDWNAPPEFPEIRSKRTWVVITFAEHGGDKTDIILTHLGWRKGEQWGQVFDYFVRAWDIVLGRLQYRFSSSPIDWNMPYTP